jgi:hypothetical protein
MTDMVGRWNWDEPVLRLAGHQAVNEVQQQGLQQRAMRNPEPTSDVMIRTITGSPILTGKVTYPGQPSPAAIAAFLDVVRRLNNSVDFGEVEPAADVWRWLETLAHE